MPIGSERVLLSTALDRDVRAWLAAVGGASTARQRLLNSLVRSLKAGGAWSGLDRLWIHAAENSAQALIDLVARSAATAVNSPAFTANRGYQGNGSSSYLNLNLSAAAAGNKYARDDAGYGVWQVIADGGSSAAIGNNNDKNRLVSSGATSFAFEVNSATATNAPVVMTMTGHFHAQRTAAAVATLYRQGVSINTSVETSAAVVDCNFHMLSSPTGIGSGTPSAFSAAQIGASWIGASLAGKEAAFYSAMRTYMTAVGVP